MPEEKQGDPDKRMQGGVAKGRGFAGSGGNALRQRTHLLEIIEQADEANAFMSLQE
jgi:hypothetical protein